MQSLNNTDTIIIIREHDKLCILEKLLNNDTKLEKLVSKFIDYIIQKDNQYKLQYFNLIEDNIHDVILLSNIIKISNSIAYDTPLELPISFVNNNENIIKYLNQPYIPFIPNAYYSFS